MQFNSANNYWFEIAGMLCYVTALLQFDNGPMDWKYDQLKRHIFKWIFHYLGKITVRKRSNAPLGARKLAGINFDLSIFERNFKITKWDGKKRNISLTELNEFLSDVQLTLSRLLLSAGFFESLVDELVSVLAVDAFIVLAPVQLRQVTQPLISSFQWQIFHQHQLR